MTFFDAALKVLKESGGGPLHYKEIAKRAIESKYIVPEGITPEASVGAQLYTHIKRAEASNQEPKVRQVSRGQFALSMKSKVGPLKLIEESNSEVRSKLFEHLSEINPRTFENLIGALLSNIGFENVMITKYSGDGGLDVEAELTVGGVTNVKTAVQVKRWKNNVTGKTVRELRGGLMTDQRGLIITTSSYTRDAIKEAAAEGKTPISLVDGEKLLDLLIQNEIGVFKKSVSYLELDLEGLEEFESEYNSSDVGQALSLWPLPGGTKKFVDSALKILKHVAQTEPAQSQIIEWMPLAFPKAKSESTIKGYIRVLKTLGLVEFDGESVKITEVGTDALTKEPNEVILNQLRTRVAGVAQYLDELEDTPMTLEESLSFFNRVLSVNWETTAQTEYRLRWLENVSAIKKEGGLYKIA